MSPRAGLDRAAVVDAAAKMADVSGGEVALAALAKQLGVRTPSLYNHVAGQEDLRRELALLGLRELRDEIMRGAVGKAADDALIAVARAYRCYARRRPGVYAMTQRAPDPDDAGLQAAAREILDVLSATLEGYRLAPEAEIHAIRGLRSLLHGFILLEAGGGFGMPVDTDRSFDWAVRAYIAGLNLTDQRDVDS